MPIIYHQYQVYKKNAKAGEDSWERYLYKCDVQNGFFSTTYLTEYRGVQTFAFSEGIRLKAIQYVTGANYFVRDGWYNIDVGTDSRVKQKYYHVHDKVMGDLFDVTNGTQSINTIVMARAFYGEGYELWFADEGWLFLRDDPHESIIYGTDIDVKIHKTLSLLGSEVFHNLSGDAANDPNNPFAAFDQISLTPGVSDFDGILYENTSKDITDILLESESFTYTGDPIEPAVMVLCSDDIVSEDGYTVTYINNDIDSGDAVVRVEGKGEYSGIITRRFRINSASDSDPDLPINYSTGSSGGCNAISGLGLALGLVFVFKKLRRR